ncbi:rhombosortase [Rheinheimera sp. MMS21-TC3]|uniref:rhombosortase n=1 Tax=Rheinheimera sp. MMS21-TC3 TaxID=3072790 RepID=UPI0028C4A101|nr:rhombosortase [Rheinheimera sp. MMS21-TC3]WNO59823.1 rhombosortase [Rheinheimera sp. MMS21-TC3]
MLKLALTLPVANRFILPPVAVALLLSLLFLLPAQFTDWLTFERSALASGQLWRLISGQFIHLSAEHLLLNLAGLVLVWLLFAEYTAGKRYLWLLPILALGCGMGVWLFAPYIEYYVGFSGVLYGLFTWGALQDVRQRQPFGRVLLLAIIAKASYEFIFSPIPLASISANPLATAAHLSGVVSALVVFFICHLLCSKLNR